MLSAVTNTIEFPLSIKAAKANNRNDIKVYPNPSTGKIYIEGENIVNIEILNGMGQIIIETKENRNLDIGNHPVGIYFIRVTTGDGIITQKLIKQ